MPQQVLGFLCLRGGGGAKPPHSTIYYWYTRHFATPSDGSTSETCKYRRQPFELFHHLPGVV